MTDAAYWRQRCEAAEDALRRARSRIWISGPRRDVLTLLSELKPGETLQTSEIAQRLSLTMVAARMSLRKLEGAGLVDSTVYRACNGRPVGWRLGHMVVVEDEEAAS